MKTRQEVRASALAAEAMLRLKQPGKALQFAEAGLEVARRQNDRDNEGACSI
jgi:hypothetical protein